MERATRYWLSLTLIGISPCCSPLGGVARLHTHLQCTAGRSAEPSGRAFRPFRGAALKAVDRRWHAPGARAGATSRSVGAEEANRAAPSTGKRKRSTTASAPSRTRSGAVISDNEAGRDLIRRVLGLRKGAPRGRGAYQLE